MTHKTEQTAETPLYLIPIALIGNTLLLTLSVILVFFNDTSQAVLSLAYTTLVFSLLSSFVLFKSLAKTTFKTGEKPES